ncbi:MAG TPA: hypothetical protein VKP69_04395, partial [Isosphaeraceae bacterium]|nr:hypothetical protein [Isosphaeraceae bacterium]
HMTRTPNMLGKIFALGASSLLGISLAGFSPPPPPDDGPPPPPKKKGEHGPGGDLKKAYDLLRRLRSDGRTTGRSEERLRDWTERATKLYRDGLKAHEAGDPRLAHEYGAAAHDLARAIDHARNAAQYERPDPDLPPPPSGPGPEDDEARVRRDLRHAYDRIRDELDDGPGADQKFYLGAARDLYNAARRDAEAGRQERAGELARAAEAMSHVAEHLGHAADRDRPDEPPPPPDRKRERPEPKRKGFDRPEPPKRERPDDDRLPPPLID